MLFRSYPVHAEVMSAVIKARFSLILHDRPCLNTIAICLEMIVGRRREGKFRVGRDELEGTSETDQYLHRRTKEGPNGS